MLNLSVSIVFRRFSFGVLVVFDLFICLAPQKRGPADSLSLSKEIASLEIKRHGMSDKCQMVID